MLRFDHGAPDIIQEFSLSGRCGDKAYCHHSLFWAFSFLEDGWYRCWIIWPSTRPVNLNVTSTTAERQIPIIDYIYMSSSTYTQFKYYNHSYLYKPSVWPHPGLPNHFVCLCFFHAQGSHSFFDITLLPVGLCTGGTWWCPGPRLKYTWIVNSIFQMVWKTINAHCFSIPVYIHIKCISTNSMQINYLIIAKGSV